jgi:hypothetical protein
VLRFAVCLALLASMPAFASSHHPREVCEAYLLALTPRKAMTEEALAFFREVAKRELAAPTGEGAVMFGTVLRGRAAIEQFREELTAAHAAVQKALREEGYAKLKSERAWRSSFALKMAFFTGVVHALKIMPGHQAELWMWSALLVMTGEPFAWQGYLSAREPLEPKSGTRSFRLSAGTVAALTAEGRSSEELSRELQDEDMRAAYGLISRLIRWLAIRSAAREMNATSETRRDWLESEREVDVVLDTWNEADPVTLEPVLAFVLRAKKHDGGAQKPDLVREVGLWLPRRSMEEDEE